jgi:3-dehydroquinate synthetase
LLTQLGLPVTVPKELQTRQQEIVSCMMLDKKTEGRELRFVLPSRIGQVEVVKGLSPEQALKCL